MINKIYRLLTMDNLMLQFIRKKFIFLERIFEFFDLKYQCFLFFYGL